jgi:hypothetical protein
LGRGQRVRGQIEGDVGENFCIAPEENPPEFLKETICPACVHKKAIPHERLVLWLLGKLNMQDNGCPLGRHELKNHEWLWLGIIKDERFKINSKVSSPSGGEGEG